MANLSAVLYGKKDLRLEHYPLKEPRSKEVQVLVKYAGVCNTDVHLYDVGSVGDITISTPSVIGHEFSGVVSRIGSDVTNVKPGDRVAADVCVSCGECAVCLQGRCGVCQFHLYQGIPPTNGGLTRTATVAAKSLHKLPDSVSFEEGCLVEPLAMCVSVVERAGLRLGDTVVLFGAGPIGLMMLQLARLHGASLVCVTDVREERLELARELGATHTLLVEKSQTDACAYAQNVTDVMGEKADVAFECSGAPVCQRASVYVMRPAGVLSLVGFGPDEVSFPLNEAMLRSLDIKGNCSNNFSFPTAIKLLAEDKVKVKPIISHCLPLKDALSALDLVRQGQGIKIIIDCATSN